MDRLRAGFETELGAIFLLLVSILLFLGAVYLLLLLYQKSKDRLRYRYRNYYEQAEKLVSAYQLVGKSVADLFGRESVLANHEGKKALCLILPPPIVNESITQRFEEYTYLIGSMQLPLFVPYCWTSTQNAWVIVQDKLLHTDGRKLLTFDKYIKDGRLTSTEAEKVLINIATCLSNLHLCRTSRGEALYHGFLLPRALFIDVDDKEGVKEILIAYHGLVSSIGGEKFQRYLHDLKKGSLIIDKWISNELLAQIKLLAPEQQLPQKIADVGPASDFYTFGNLGLMAFSGCRFQDVKTFDWSCVPTKWCAFLKGCLSENVNDRPKDFSEILT